MHTCNLHLRHCNRLDIVSRLSSFLLQLVYSSKEFVHRLDIQTLCIPVIKSMPLNLQFQINYLMKLRKFATSQNHIYHTIKMNTNCAYLHLQHVSNSECMAPIPGSDIVAMNDCPPTHSLRMQYTFLFDSLAVYVSSSTSELRVNLAH